MKSITIGYKNIRRKTDLLPRYVNRDIQSGHVKSLIKSIQMMGLVRDVILVKAPFIHKTKLFLVDGQHLREACLKLKLDMTCKVIETESIEDLIAKISTLNSTAKCWKLADYLEAWCTADKRHYKYLRSRMNDVGKCSVSSIIEAYTVTGNKDSESFKKGTFVLKSNSKATGDRITNIYKDCVSKGLKESSTSLVAISRICKKYDVTDSTKLTNVISRNLPIFSRSLKRDELIFHLDNFYNSTRKVRKIIK